MEGFTKSLPCSLLDELLDCKASLERALRLAEKDLTRVSGASFDFRPKTFLWPKEAAVLHEAIALSASSAAARGATSVLWIGKPVAGADGRGIQLLFLPTSGGGDLATKSLLEQLPTDSGSTWAVQEGRSCVFRLLAFLLRVPIHIALSYFMLRSLCYFTERLTGSPHAQEQLNYFAPESLPVPVPHPRLTARAVLGSTAASTATVARGPQI
jgi:hypothetical protein